MVTILAIAEINYLEVNLPVVQQQQVISLACFS